MARARRHFGNVRKLPSGRFQASYWLEGNRYVAPTTFLAKTDALAYLSTVEADTIRGRWRDPRGASTSFADFAESWLAAGGSRAAMRESTRAKYRGLLDRHLLPTFGKLRLAKIRPVDVASWYGDLARRHPATAAGAYRLLATLFNSAIKQELVPSSPCQIEGASREASAERSIATITECQAAVEATPPRYRVAVLLGAWGQLRRGEVLALQRRDIDIAAGRLRVQREWVVTEDGRTLLGPPKSDAGARSVFLPAHVVRELTLHLKEFTGPQDDAWLFPGTRPGDPLHPRTFSRIWDRARRVAGRPELRFHDLRHTGLTWTAQAGATTAELMRRAGHASPAAALRYQHAADERDRSLAQALDAMRAPS